MRTILLLLICIPGFAQSSKEAKVHFLYGSRPAKGFKDTEKKWFGGIHGGHVSIELDGIITGFVPIGKNHLLPTKKGGHSQFEVEQLSDWVKDTAGLKYTSIIIPLSDSQYTQLHSIILNYTRKPPYDYAVLGMRCASATYDIISKLGLLKEKSNFGNICSNFFPQPFRRKMLKKAKELNFVVVSHPGRRSRVWEKE